MEAGLKLLLQVLPLALGAAMSPTVLTVQILVLSSGPGGLRRGWGLAAGRMAALLAFSVASLFLLVQLPDFSTGKPSWVEAGLFLVAGLLLLALTYWEWRRRNRPEKPSKLGEKLSDANPVYLFLFGAGWMLVNASTLALYIPALHIITSSDTSDVAKIVVFAVLFVITSAVVLVPVLVLTFYGEKGKALLLRVHHWVDSHSHDIAIVVSGVFGVALIGAGVWATVSLL